MPLGLLSVADNVVPIAWWTPISQEPFRFRWRWTGATIRSPNQ